MSSPSPRTLLRAVLGHHVAEAALRSGVAAEPLAKSALRAWATTLPSTYLGQAPDRLPYRSAAELLQRCGLEKAEELSPKLDREVVALVKASSHKAEEALKSRFPVGVAQPTQLDKAQPIKTPTDAPGVPGQRPPIAPTPPTKQPARVKPGIAKKPQPLAVEFTKHETDRVCKRCGMAHFEKAEFVGCLCWSELGRVSVSSLTKSESIRVVFGDGDQGRRFLREMGR